MLFDRQRVLLELWTPLMSRSARRTSRSSCFFTPAKASQLPSYDFVPYRFGCFSFTSYADKRRLAEQELIEDGETWKLTEKGRGCACRRKVAAANGTVCQAIQKLRRGNALVRGCLPALPVFRDPQ